MHLCTASRFRFCFLSCKSFNPENPDSDNKDALLNKQIQFPFGIYREACDNLALVLTFQRSEDSLIVDLRINETLQTGAVSNQRKRENGKTRKRDTFGRHCFQLCRCGAVGNRTYRGAKVSIYF